MWPLLLDMTRDECKRMLRRLGNYSLLHHLIVGVMDAGDGLNVVMARLTPEERNWAQKKGHTHAMSGLELEAYGSVVSALRAQGDLTKDKKKLLHDLGAKLNISMERHRAEIRRAVNDEHLTTIADHMSGSSSSSAWAIEGRRLIPLMPRLVPQTAFTALANNVASITAAENAKIPAYSATKIQKAGGGVGDGLQADEDMETTPSVPEETSPARSIHENCKDSKEKPQKRPSGSPPPSPPPPAKMAAPPPPTPPITAAAPVPAPVPTQTPTTATTTTTTTTPTLAAAAAASPSPAPRVVTLPGGASAMKITLAPTTVTTTIAQTTTSTTNTTTTSSATHKVIIVSSANNPGQSSHLVPRTVPVVKTVSATAPTVVPTRVGNTNLVVSRQVSGNTSKANGVFVSGNTSTMTPTTVSIGGVPTAAYITSQSGSSNAMTKIRPKAPILTGVKPMIQPRRGSIVIPVTPTQPSPVSLPSPKSVQIRHEGALKIISQTVPISSVNSAAKILPKPPVYVVTTTPSSGVTVVTRTVSAPSGTRLVTVSSSANPRLSTGGGSTVRPVLPGAKPVQTVHITSQGSGLKSVVGKPNVIVVQKGTGLPRGVVLGPGAKEMMSRVGKSGASATAVTTTTVVQGRQAVRLPLGQVPMQSGQALNLPVSAGQSNVIVLGLSPEQLSKNTVLADILQATGILGDKVIETHNESNSGGGGGSGSGGQGYQTNDWMQMEMEDHTAEDEEEEEEEEEDEDEDEEEEEEDEIEEVDLEKEEEEANRRAQLSSQQNSQPQISVQEVSLPLELPEGQVVTLEEAVELLGKSGSAEARALLKQAGIDLGVLETKRGVKKIQQQVTRKREEEKSKRKEQPEEDQVSDDGVEVVGHLDPETGIFTFPSPPASKKSSEPKMDIFSTALASADIHLDPYQYTENNAADAKEDDGEAIEVETVTLTTTEVMDEEESSAVESTAEST